MLIAAAFTASMMGLLAFALLVCVVAAILLRKRSPVALRTPLPNVGGLQAGFDILPCVTSSLALASPPARTHAPPSAPDPLGAVLVTGRGQHIDRHCADDVAITITSDRLWIDVDGKDSVRIYRIKRLSIDDRRAI